MTRRISQKGYILEITNNNQFTLALTPPLYADRVRFTLYFIDTDAADVTYTYVTCPGLFGNDSVLSICESWTGQQSGAFEFEVPNPSALIGEYTYSILRTSDSDLSNGNGLLTVEFMRD